MSVLFAIIGYLFFGFIIVGLVSLMIMAIKYAFSKNDD